MTDDAAATGAGQPARPLSTGAMVATGGLQSPRFANDASFLVIAEGTGSLGPKASGKAVEKLQWTLLGLGFELPRFGADGSYGDEVASALSAFQSDAGLAVSGLLDGPTLLALDVSVATRLNELRALAPSPDDKRLRYHVIADLVRSRIVVLDRSSGDAGGTPVASYLTSPGLPQYPTKGDHFVLQATLVLSWWQPPPDADWARGLQAAPPGTDNPMGVCKLSFGEHAQYFHGIPRHEEADLGHPASHGCCRMSGANILEFHQLYAGAGTDVKLLRDRGESALLAERVVTAGVLDRPISAGREYTAAYLYRELGENEHLSPDGKIHVG